MAKNLVIVESPTKAKTINKFLGKEFDVQSSFGHIRDLPKSKLGVEVENNFEPQYVTPPKAEKVVDSLKKKAKKAKSIILATDEDREGEAIAWHLVQTLEIDPKKCQRIVFHEITKQAIEKALENPRAINQQLVDAQQGRRVLDRLVGYKLSPLLWAKIMRGLSAGRVQSAALRMIVEREKEINAFTPQEYWSIEAALSKGKDNLEAKLFKKDGKTLDKLAIENEKQSQEILKSLEEAEWKIENLQTKQTKRNPTPPFITSTLQQAANSRLGYSSRQTMVLAQQLYEGLEMGEEDAAGLITYMRTDSVNMSEQALTESQEVIKDLYGDKYLIPKPRQFKRKSKGAQEAHEAIRPTSFARTPELVKPYLDAKQFKLYRLIWQRALASQMPEANLESTSIDVGTGTPYTFRASGQVVIFDGFLKVYGKEKDEEKDNLLPQGLEVGDKLDLEKLNPKQHFTLPPPRFNDASLVKALEEHGIGRPSTYAPTISTLENRNYIEREQRAIMATEIGIVVSDFLEKHFSEIVDYDFTAEMENKLDEIATGHQEWKKVVSQYYIPFAEKIETKEETIERVSEPIDDLCPECQGPMVARFGRYGRFGACVRYPDCSGTIPLDKNEIELAEKAAQEKCPECQAELVVRRGRFGSFLGCSRYPECKGILKIEKKFGPCPKCKKGEVVERRGGKGKRIFYGCTLYPECDFTSAKKPGQDEDSAEKENSETD